jgi:hypothetical protein
MARTLTDTPPAPDVTPEETSSRRALEEASPLEDDIRCDLCGAPFGCCDISCDAYTNPDDPEWVERERRRLWDDWS